MKVISKEGKILDVTKKAFDVVYSSIGYKEHKEEVKAEIKEEIKEEVKKPPKKKK